MNFWSFVLDDHWSKKIYRPKMIVDVWCYIHLRWSCLNMLLSGNGYYQLAQGNYVGGLIIKYRRSHRPNHRISVHIIGQDNKRKNYTISYQSFWCYHHFYIFKNTGPIILGCTFGEKYPIRAGWKGREVMPIWGRGDTLSSHYKCFSPARKPFCIRL